MKKTNVAKGLTMKLGLDTRRPAHVPLRDAMLCIDCEFVSPSANGNCSICSSDRLVVLSELLELLLEQAFGDKAPIRLVDLAAKLVGESSVKRTGDTKQGERSRLEPWRFFES